MVDAGVVGDALQNAVVVARRYRREQDDDEGGRGRIVADRIEELEMLKERVA